MKRKKIQMDDGPEPCEFEQWMTDKRTINEPSENRPKSLNAHANFPNTFTEID